MDASDMFQLGDEVELSQYGKRNLTNDKFIARVVGFSRNGRCVWIQKTHCKNSNCYHKDYLIKTNSILFMESCCCKCNQK